MTELTALQAMLCSYAPVEARTATRWVFGVDNRMAAIIRTTSEPLLGQLRLSWWRDALNADPSLRPAGEKLLNGLRALDHDFPSLARGTVQIIDGWEVLLTSERLCDDDLENYARERGAGLFNVLATLTNDVQAQGLERAGKCWALWDLACHLSDPNAQQRALNAAIREWGSGLSPHWPRTLRPLSMLIRLMKADLDAGQLGRSQHGKQWFRLVWHGLTGH